MANDSVKALKLELTTVLRAREADSTTAALALADLLGLVAAKLDSEVGVVPFEERWKEITAAARIQYENYRLGVRRSVTVSNVR